MRKALLDRLQVDSKIYFEGPPSCITFGNFLRVYDVCGDLGEELQRPYTPVFIEIILVNTEVGVTDTVATDTVATDTVATDTVATDTVATDIVRYIICSLLGASYYDNYIIHTQSTFVFLGLLNKKGVKFMPLKCSPRTFTVSFVADNTVVFSGNRKCNRKFYKKYKLLWFNKEDIEKFNVLLDIFGFFLSEEDLEMVTIKCLQHLSWVDKHWKIK